MLTGGTTPGQTTDMVAIRYAELMRKSLRLFVNITSVGGVYDQDPKLGNATLLPELTASDYLSRFSATHRPGLSLPMEPKAVENALTDIYIIGPDIKELENVIYGRKFSGTLIKSGADVMY
ncbi:MAG: hypothetical protein N3E38_02080 [Candidatus Aenigmarchaeota archaeon]|nr:hypothetical protein [Candidatus Aenigmarchaeota archaeon]